MVDRSIFGTVTCEWDLAGRGSRPARAHRTAEANEAQDVSPQGVIGREIGPRPDRLRRPRLGGGGPERIARGQPDRQQADGTQIRAPRRDVALPDLRLMAGKPDGEPS